MTDRTSYLPALILLPSIVLHELTHVLVAWKWADISIDSLVPTVLKLHYQKETPVLVTRLANVAPTIIGVLVAPFIVPWALEATVPVMVYALGSWLTYTAPSHEDLFATPTT